MIKSYLMEPAWWCTEQYYRIFSLHLPKEQIENFSVEVIYRVGLSLITIPATVVAIIAAGGAAISSCFEKAPPFIHEISLAPEISPKTFRVFQANICGMSGLLPLLFGGVQPIRWRVDQLAKKIIQSGANIVCLQEAHDPLSIGRLANQLGKAYAHVIYQVDEPSELSRLGSGILFASQIKINSVHFHRFKASSGDQKSVNKGFMVCDLENQLRLITTHLQPGSTETDLEIRDAQMEEILPYVNAMTLLAGDFNDERSRGKVADLFYDPIQASVETCTEALGAYRKGENYFKEGESIDYILTSTDSKLQFSKIELLPLYDKQEPWKALSDHQALIADFDG